MRDRWNLILAFVSSAWTALIALAVVPYYLHFLGIEAYGLIGFFVAMQALFGILDLGLSATISREVARCRAGGDIDSARDLLRTLAVIYWLIAVAIGLVIVLAAGPIADGWLSDTAMSSTEVRAALMLMGVVVALRWPVALYNGALIGGGGLGYVSAVTILFSTLANIGAVLILWLVSPTITAFFAWQAVCALMLVIATTLVAWHRLPGHRRPRFDRPGLVRIWRFSAGLSVAAVIGTVFMQSDKVLLSRILPLSELGGYVLAGTVARALYIILTPAFNIIYPRMTGMISAGDEGTLTAYYRWGTQLLIAVIVPVAAFAAFHAHDLLLAWTNDTGTARMVAPLVPWMIAGTAMNGVMHFPYALQLAAGRASLPALINLILLVLFVPLLTVLALRYGVLGGAIAWAALNGAYVLVGTWLTHRSILPGLGARWLVRDVAMPAAIALAVTAAGALAIQAATGNPLLRLLLATIVLIAATIMSTLSCPPALSYLRRRFGAQALPSAH